MKSPWKMLQWRGVFCLFVSVFLFVWVIFVSGLLGFFSPRICNFSLLCVFIYFGFREKLFKMLIYYQISSFLVCNDEKSPPFYKMKSLDKPFWFLSKLFIVLLNSLYFVLPLSWSFHGWLKNHIHTYCSK